MGMIKFDSSGKLILPQSVQRDISEEEGSIIMTRVQVSEKSPAIAQLRIKLGKKKASDRDLMNRIKDQCERYVRYKQASSETKIELGEEEVMIEARGSYDMYLYLQELMMTIKNSHGKAVIRGTWAR
jgi:hypothetical protein